MKKYIAILMILTILICSAGTTVLAENGSVSQSGDWLYTLSEGEATVTGYSGGAKAVNIPGNLNGYPVTAIGRAAFFRAAFETVSVPASVREIGWWAFYGAQSLKKLTLADGLQRVDFGAFINCPSLREVELPSTVCAIGADAFGVSCVTATGVPDYPSDRLVSTQSYSADYTFSVRGWSGTAAQYYAQTSGYEFESIGALHFGDVNADRAINAADLLMIQNKEPIPTEAQRRSADLNGDGTIDDADASLLSDYLSGQIAYHEIPAASFNKPEQSWLYGKKMYCDGDSIAKGTGTDTFGSAFHSYCHYIGDRYGMTYEDLAVGGTTLARVKNNPITDRESILERVLKMKGSYDVILLDGGFNDLFLKVKAGKMTDLTDKRGVYDETTTLGALEKICYFLNKNYKDAVKLFVLCHEYDHDRQDSLWDSMKQVLDKWEIPYIDMREETDFTAVNREINNQYFFCNDSEPVADELHPLEYPHIKIYGTCVEERLNGLFAQRSELSMSRDELTLAKDESESVTVRQDGFDYYGVLNWTSSDESVVSVQNGYLTANAVGTAYVRAETADGRIVAVRVEVKQSPLCVYLNRSAAALNPFEGTRLIPEFLEGTVSHSVTYTSSDENVAVVYADGSVVARSRGTATITCKLSNGVKTACEVIVQ